MIYKKERSSYHGVEKEDEQEMGVGRRKKRGCKKIEGFISLQAVEFDVDAIQEIKRRKRRLCKRGATRKI